MLRPCRGQKYRAGDSRLLSTIAFAKLRQSTLILKSLDEKIRRVLVTGASGFIGNPLVFALHRAGYAVRVATRRSVSFLNSVEKVIIPDLAYPVGWEPVLRDVDIVIHLAGLAHTNEDNLPFDEFYRVNWIATLRLVNAAKQARVKHFVYISSVRAQVGAFAAQLVCERDQPKPTDNYGRSKLAAEQAIKSANLPFTILRPVVVYGPHPKGNFRALVRLSLLPLPLPVKGLTARRSLLGIDNLISAILFVLNDQRTLGQTFLVADPAPLTLPEIIRMLRKAQGLPERQVYAPTFLIRRILMVLGYQHLWERIDNNLVVDTRKLESLGWHAPLHTYEGFVAMVSAENGKTSQDN
jgi:nucleoside-diphosphate-sugar epimerase